jgi:hypothetical protein
MIEGDSLGSRCSVSLVSRGEGAASVRGDAADAMRGADAEADAASAMRGAGANAEEASASAMRC